MKKTTTARFAVALLVPTTVFGLGAGPAVGQAFPSKPIAFIVPYGPGTGNDVIARVVSNKVSENWGHPIVVDNRLAQPAPSARN